MSINNTGSILLRRGPTSDRSLFCPLEGEIIFDTTSYKVFVGDGQTYGGLPVGTSVGSLNDLTDVDTSTSPPTNSQVLTWNSSTSLWVPGTMTSNGVYVLPTATTSTLGGVKVDGSTITISNGVISSTGGGGGGGSYTLPTATTSILGGVKVDGTTITINNGVISSTGGGGSYTLPTASTSTLGGVKVDGSTITISNGVIKVSKLQAYSETVITNIVSTTTYNLDLSAANIFDFTLSNNVTFTFINPPASGSLFSVSVILRQDSVGNRLATFTNAKYSDGILPVLSSTANQIDVLSFFTVNGGSFWFGTFAMANVS